MFAVSRWITVLAVLSVLSLLSATPALAIYPQLSTKLAGPAINGVVPEGDANIDQSKLPSQPGMLKARVKNVNLPDGTALSVFLTDCGPSAVGTIVLSGGSGELSSSLRSGCPIGRTSSIFVKLGDATILSGGSPWKA